MLSIVDMNKRSILTAVLALGLGISALTGCATDSDSAHSYVTPKDVKTVERPIAQIGDSGIKVPEKRDLKIKLADSEKATKWKIEVSDPTALEVGKSEKNVVTLHPLRALGEDDAPVTVSPGSADPGPFAFWVLRTFGAGCYRASINSRSAGRGSIR